MTPIDVATNTAGAPIPGFNSPIGIAITSNGNTAYVANQAGHSVTPINVASNTAGTAITVGANPIGIAITPGPSDTTPPTVTYTGNAGSYTVGQQVNITCVAADEPGGSGLASSTCQNVVGPAAGFGLGTRQFSATATDNAGNVGNGSGSFTVTATPTAVGSLTLQYMQASAKYMALTVNQKAVFTRTVNALLAVTLNRINSGTRPAAKALLVAAYKLGVRGLVVGGWLTTAQANQLSGFASAL